MSAWGLAEPNTQPRSCFSYRVSSNSDMSTFTSVGWAMAVATTRPRLPTRESAYVAQALSLVGKRGRVVATAIAHPSDVKVDMSLFELTLYEKQLRGCVFGSANPHADIPRLLSLYRSGLLQLDELVTRTYRLDEVNEGYQDMFAGVNIRGVIHHTP